MSALYLISEFIIRVQPPCQKQWFFLVNGHTFFIVKNKHSASLDKSQFNRKRVNRSRGILFAGPWGMGSPGDKK
jgi:hypothetical protein